MSWWNSLREQRLALALSLFCALAYLPFLLRYGPMFFWGSDLVANAAYGVTMFSEVLSTGWTVPKPAEMLLFGTTYWVVGDLWILHVVMIAATSLTVWAGCRLILKKYNSLAGCLVFCILMVATPRIFRATLAGGAGVLSTACLFLALLWAEDRGRRRPPALFLAFLSLANLARPDAWPCTYLVIFALFALRWIDRRSLALHRGDLWFLVPISMPLAWGLLGWAVFGDPLYSMHIAETFVTETIDPEHTSIGLDLENLVGYFARLKKSVFGLLAIDQWISARAAASAVLLLAGAAAMIRRNRRVSLLIACLLGGTLLFYFVYAVLGTLFRTDYIYTALVCLVFVLGIGVGAAAGAVGSLRPRWLGATLAVAGTVGIVLFLALGPVRDVTIKETLPILQRRARDVARTQPAIERLIQDIERSGIPTPIILATRWVPPSRIALEHGTGKDVYFVERILSQKFSGEESALPPLAGRTLYFCGREHVMDEEKAFVQPLVDASQGGGVLYKHDDVLILKCEY